MTEIYLTVVEFYGWSKEQLTSMEITDIKLLEKEYLYSIIYESNLSCSKV
ncbi:hypothetical protein C8C77_11313 [Halanaerobium saccharolyticum]|jgi:hypothetical protein|uniref:Uncharacterized protein n=1 Tax=Halanaerobium saccharolyticum TaxID=43595 RepID=A0A4R7YZR5_9FIRM|nr:hypothetical protein [Halanaerobium saccharolyticum]RAK07468.1 hypothetical protein C7958_11413 [Halanaerobium saccharolyticum]TDW03045.1 hypothetical protein C8C77_11313 [Halanaerobium saccharolyticum]TDX59341.1 hypothetical protein C7956_11513 [Halanaerobium saccharolyticum]